MADAKLDLTLAKVTEDDLEPIVELEKASYHPDEAATAEKLTFRAKHASDFFLVARIGEEIVGFICGTLSETQQLVEETMSEHNSGGKYLCIHSVVVAEKFRRKKIGVQMMQQYLQFISSQSQLLQIILICHEYLIKFYASSGFKRIGKSSIVHGPDPWFEMRYDIKKS